MLKEALSKRRKPVMAIDEHTVRKISDLARIAVTNEQVPVLAKELEAILAFVEQLGEVNTQNVTPMTSAIPQPLPMRSDMVTDGGYPDDIVKNAPSAIDHFFAVPKVVE
jgi:aspartyl-tRNA(Asn)/glutamyl-tRNA(Gln) amidotransferase subunit C